MWRAIRRLGWTRKKGSGSSERNEEERAAWLAHTPYLVQATRRISDGTEDERGHRAVELRFGEGQFLNWGAREGDRDGHDRRPARKPSSSNRQHRAASSGSVASTRTTWQATENATF